MGEGLIMRTEKGQGQSFIVHEKYSGFYYVCDKKPVDDLSREVIQNNYCL